MREKRALWRRAFVPGLVMALSLGSAYALACPMLCSAAHCCAGRADGSTMPGMPGSHPCCPAHSDGRNGAPCKAPARQCLAHAPSAAYLMPAGPVLPQCHATVIFIVGTPASLSIPTLPVATSGFLSPPGYSSGRTICQKESFLRI